MDSEFVKGLIGVGLVVLGLVFRDQYRRWRQRKGQRDFQPHYDVFLQKHGELYEKQTLPFTDADRRKIVLNYNFILGLLSLLGVLFIVLLFVMTPESKGEYVADIAVVCMITAFIWVIRNTKKKILQTNEKTVIKGVITNKNYTDRGERDFDHYIEISRKDNILISRRDYRRYAFGDIVKIEVLGNPTDLSIRRTISRLGKI